MITKKKAEFVRLLSNELERRFVEEFRKERPFTIIHNHWNDKDFQVILTSTIKLESGNLENLCLIWHKGQFHRRIYYNPVNLREKL